MTQPSFCPRGIRGADKVEGCGLVFERLVAVGKSFWDVHHQAVFCRQGRSKPLEVSRRIRADVDDHVVDCTLHAAYEFDLRVRRFLEVHATHGTCDAILAEVSLSERRNEPLAAELIGAKRSRKESAIVRSGLPRDRVGILQGYGVKNHRSFLGLIHTGKSRWRRIAFAGRRLTVNAQGAAS